MADAASPGVTRVYVVDADGAAANLGGAVGPGTATAANRVTHASNDPLLTAVGEVQASPTSNTVLDRLKALLTGIVLAAGTAAIGAVKDNGPNWTTVWGVSSAPVNSADASSAVSVTDAPTSGQKIVLDDVHISVGSAISVSLKCETSAAVIWGPVYMAANTSMMLSFRGKGPKLAIADKKLQVVASGAGNITVMAGYHSEA